ncbi:MAG: TolC family protein [Bacteroidales bacterium]|nr:TolC family protein [Bacteroidales bacterium]
MRFNHLSLAIACIFAGIYPQLSAQEQLKADDMPQAWMYAADLGMSQTLPTDDHWWTTFGDSTLNRLITIGIDRNYDVLMAQRRIAMAKQTLRQARAGYYPQLSFSGGWTRSRSSGMTTKEDIAPTTLSYFDLGVDMNWEIDVFGKITAKAKQAKAGYNATKAEYDATMVSMAAKIATAYFQFRTIQNEMLVFSYNIESQLDVLNKTKARFEAGISSKLDVTQASTTYYSTLASMSSLNSSKRSILNSLAILLGMFPEDVVGLLDENPTPLPEYKQIMSVGVPMELLRRRPDVVEAEYTLAGYAAALGIAKKDFLPTLSISGSISTAAHDIDNLFKNHSLGYTIAPTLSWTIFDGFARSAAVASAKEQMQIGIDNYNLTLVNAVSEVETAMSDYFFDLEYIDELQKVVDNAKESLELSLNLYKSGLSDFINVNDSQISLLTYANQLVVAKGNAIADLITLYQALGGGWQ